MTAERILITGGSGFIGANLARNLIAAGKDVHLLVREQADPWRLAGIESQCTMRRADLLDLLAVRRVVAACRPHVVFHLAAHGAYAFQQDRAAILATNLLGTANLLQALEYSDYRALVNVGSSSEYGHKAEPMCPADRLEPRTDYAVSKAAATMLCQAEALKGRPVTTVRVFSAYGPWEDARRLVPSVVESCRRGEPPQVTAGWQPRDFIYVDDVVELLIAAADCPAAMGNILHAGSGTHATVRDMVETIVAVVGQGHFSARYGAISMRDGEPALWQADLKETIALTGWQPRHDLRQGVEKTVAWSASREMRKAA